MYRFLILSFVLVLSTNLILISAQLPKEIFDIKLTETYTKLKKSFNLKKLNSDEELVKLYKIDYIENNIQTFLYFFNSKVYKIRLEYEENFIQDENLQNLYNQAVLLYGLPNKIETKQLDSNLTIKIYLWEDDNVEYIYESIIQKDKIKKLSVLLIDKTIKQKITTLTPTKKLLYKIKNLF